MRHLSEVYVESRQKNLNDLMQNLMISCSIALFVRDMAASLFTIMEQEG